MFHLIELHDNKVDGQTTAIRARDLVEQFAESEYADEPYISTWPFRRTFMAFLLDYDIEGMKRYEPLSEDDWAAIRHYWRERDDA
jgi:hypothetical protein